MPIDSVSPAIPPSRSSPVCVTGCHSYRIRTESGAVWAWGWVNNDISKDNSQEIEALNKPKPKLRSRTFVQKKNNNAG